MAEQEDLEIEAVADIITEFARNVFKQLDELDPDLLEGIVLEFSDGERMRFNRACYENSNIHALRLSDQDPAKSN